MTELATQFFNWVLSFLLIGGGALVFLRRMTNSTGTPATLIRRVLPWLGILCFWTAALWVSSFPLPLLLTLSGLLLAGTGFEFYRASNAKPDIVPQLQKLLADLKQLRASEAEPAEIVNRLWQSRDLLRCRLGEDSRFAWVSGLNAATPVMLQKLVDSSSPADRLGNLAIVHRELQRSRSEEIPSSAPANRHWTRHPVTLGAAGVLNLLLLSGPVLELLTFHSREPAATTAEAVTPQPLAISSSPPKPCNCGKADQDQQEH